jgi:N-carbamoylputrescine amidase
MFSLAIAAGAAPDREQLPGRQVKVAAIAIGFGGKHDEKLHLALDHLEKAGENGVDIACLPEEFSGTEAEPIPGPTTDAVGALARKHHMYVICPIREQAADGRQYNTAVLLDRSGRIAGYYRKCSFIGGKA